MVESIKLGFGIFLGKLLFDISIVVFIILAAFVAVLGYWLYTVIADKLKRSR